MDVSAFEKEFLALSGYSPFPWQRRLYTLLVQGQAPQNVTIPSGLGKTAVMLVWLIALAHQQRQASVSLPRRLVYVVNRRTVVDQATWLAEKIRQRLCDSNASSCLREDLRRLAGFSDPPLAISTLRGQLADNGEWRADPARPAIVIGTVDMIGSRLLFSGFGDGRWERSQHAGLLGQDCLLIHDEAHLDPAFATLLEGITRLQQAYPSGLSRPLQVMYLTATPRDTTGPTLTLSQEDRVHPVVKTRVEAEKLLSLYRTAAKDLPQTMAGLAASYEGQKAKVLIFVSNPIDAQHKVLPALKKQLKSPEHRVAMLTGIMRGWERDRLLKQNPVFKAFLGDTTVEETLYLIATSAGEVGVDLDADHLVSDLSTLDSLLQRLGRVNRQGGPGRKAKVHLLITHEEDEEESQTQATKGTARSVTQARQATKRLLERWAAQETPLNLAPARLEALLSQLPEADREAAFSPKPEVKPLTPWAVSFLAATSLSDLPPGTPSVNMLLHGDGAAEPEVSLMWRCELPLLENLSELQVQQWVGACRPLPWEQLRYPLAAFNKYVEKLNPPEAARENKALLIAPGRPPTWLSLAALKRPHNLAFALIQLPASWGGFDGNTGMPDVTCKDPVLDVAETTPNEQTIRRRALEISGEEGSSFFDLQGKPLDIPCGWVPTLKLPLKTDEEGTPLESLCLFLPPREVARDEPELTTGQVTLAEHTAAVKEWARLLAQKLRLPPELTSALEVAAGYHDEGKRSPIWQSYANAPSGSEPLAKSNSYRSPKALSGFRHELVGAQKLLEDGTLDLLLENGQSPLYCSGDGPFIKLLAAHLVASHHGWSRPNFPEHAQDPDLSVGQNRRLRYLLANNFALLQSRLGWWMLAWLEAIFRCADGLASRVGAPT